jgi:hypothetical protein
MTDVINVPQNDYANQYWLITPSAYAVNEVPPADIIDQRWLLTLSGIAEVNFQGTSVDWQHAYVNMVPPGDTSLQAALGYAMSQGGITQPPNTYPYFKVQDDDGYSVFAGVNSVDQASAVSAGFAVDNVGIQPIFGTDAYGVQVDNLFGGITVYAGVRGPGASLYRVGYNVTLQGVIAFIAV